MPSDSTPPPGGSLPEELESVCAEVAQDHTEPVLLVGTDPDLTGRVACRINALTYLRRGGRKPSVGVLGEPELRRRYEMRSCRGMPPSFARGPGSELHGLLRDVRVLTLHLVDVECATDEVGWEVHRHLSEPQRGRVVASTTSDPEQWPHGPLLDLLRTWRRILVGVPETAADQKTQPVPAPDQEEGEPGANPKNVFRRSTTGWEVTFAGDRAHFADSGGMRAIAHLLSLPDGTPRGGATEVRRAMSGDPETVELLQAQSSGVEVADEQALSEARGRLRDIELELTAGDLNLSVERREELEEEHAAVSSYVDGAVGLGGRTRTLGGSRGDGQAVGAAIRRALRQIKKAHPDLFAHLDNALRDPYSDAVRYEPRKETAWDVKM